MAWTQADIDKLKTAMASGLQSTTIAGQQISLQSVDNNMKLLAAMEREVNGGARVRLASTSKGA